MIEKIDEEKVEKIIEKNDEKYEKKIVKKIVQMTDVQIQTDTVGFLILDRYWNCFSEASRRDTLKKSSVLFL